MEVLDRPVSVVTEYQPFYAQLAKLESDNEAIVFDYESRQGNKEARSHINTLRLTKGALERTRKSAKEDSLRIGRAVDSEAKEINTRIEAMITVHQVKIDEIEQREKDRVLALQMRLDELTMVNSGMTADYYRSRIAVIEEVAIGDDWQEFIADASRAKDKSLTECRRLLAERNKQDADAADLERLRKESVDRAQKDREEAIAKAAGERAKADAELRAKSEREASDRRELELKLQAETADRRRIEAEQRAEKDANDAAERAEQSRLKAIQDEKNRVAAIARAEAEAQAKREANTAHKAKINRAALAALVAGGIDEETAKKCVTLIAGGKVPSVQINY